MNLVISACVVLSLLLGAARPAVAQVPRGYEVVQVTQNAYLEFVPRINNRGQFVFTAWMDVSSRLTEEIYFYDGKNLIRLTNDNVQDVVPDINDDGTIVWSRGIGPVDPFSGEPTLEIVRWREGQLTRLTDNAVQDVGPRINNLGQVAWHRDHPVFACGGPLKDIFMYDGSRVIQITHDALIDIVENQTPVINDLGQIAWTRYDFCAGGSWEGRIMMYDNGLINELTNGQHQPQSVAINNLGQVAWDYNASPDPNVIELWDAGVTSTLVEGGRNAAINDAGDVTFNRWDDLRRTWDVWLMRDNRFYAIGADPSWDTGPDIDQIGQVVWGTGRFPVKNIRFLRRFANGDLNCDGDFNGADIDPFFFALGDPFAYAAAFPTCDPLLADMNADGAVNGGDIDPFFEALGGG